MGRTLENLFIFEMANNHQGDLAHGLKIIEALGELAKREKIRGAVKFQFRDLDTFIHPHHREQSNNKHIPRFQGTRLTTLDFEVLKQAVTDAGLLSICTPFDERSVDEIVRMDFDIIKVASCSASDRPLIEKIRQTTKPVIASTAGASLSDVDYLVERLEDRNSLALMHCVAIYPTPSELLQLARIATLKKRYPSLVVGFSTHEEPNDFLTVQLAYAQGARIFEKHVGLPHDSTALNSYSATPEQIEKWIASWKSAVARCGSGNALPTVIEERSLLELRRGVFLKHDIKKDSPITMNDIFFAMPVANSAQATSSDWRGTAIADQDYAALEPLNLTALPKPTPLEYAREDALRFLRSLGVEPKMEQMPYLSHHHGIDAFEDVGAIIMTIYHQAYCKKLIAMLPDQWHPKHKHSLRDETFEILHGDLEINLDTETLYLSKGDVISIPAGTWHDFRTNGGVLIEEITSLHTANDSIYESPRIAQLTQSERKSPLLQDYDLEVKEKMVGTTGVEPMTSTL